MRGFPKNPVSAKTPHTEQNSNYIIEEGSNANGSYRKWSNGNLEMWGAYSFQQANINAQTGSIYYSNAYLVTLPVQSIKSAIGIVFTLLSNGSAWVIGSTNGNGKNNIGFRLGAGISYSASGTLHWRCTGTWK